MQKVVNADDLLLKKKEQNSRMRYRGRGQYHFRVNLWKVTSERFERGDGIMNTFV